MQKEIKILENSKSSMAVLHIKKYKIVQDYRTRISKVEKVQKFVMEKILLIPAPKLFAHRNKNELPKIYVSTLL